MDKTTRRQQNSVAALLFGLALEEILLYPKSYLASCAFALVVFGLIYWFIPGSE